MKPEEAILQLQKLLEANGGITGGTRVIPELGSSLREYNKKMQKRILENGEDFLATKAFLLRKNKEWDISDQEKFVKPVREGRFSWKALRAKLEEADASSSFTPFLRAGIMTITNGMYESVEDTYSDWVKVVPSSKDTELYAPNQGLGFPRQVGPEVPYPMTGVAALNLQLKNYKFGTMYAVERELLEDDQTGTFAQQAGMMGEYMKLLAEVWCYGKLASATGMQYSDLKIPTSETKPSYEANYPYTSSAAPFVGGGYNKPAVFTALTQPAIQSGIIGLMAQKNLQGLKMLVNPRRLIISPQNSFDAAVLMHSSYYPSGAAAAGVPGGAFAINPIKSILDMTVSRFVFKNDGTVDGTSKAWYIVDDSKPFFVLQEREAISLEQEAPNAGQSFDFDITRFKARKRMNADFIDPRFVWQGNDGSV